jgi:hypothetical protein
VSNGSHFTLTRWWRALCLDPPFWVPCLAEKAFVESLCGRFWTLDWYALPTFMADKRLPRLPTREHALRALWQIGRDEAIAAQNRVLALRTLLEQLDVEPAEEEEEPKTWFDELTARRAG